MTHFTERQRFALWAELLVALPVVAVAGALYAEGESLRTTLLALGGTALSMGLVYVLIFQMTTEVDEQELRVHFGYIPTYRWRMPCAEILEAKAVQYNPIREYGGWGIRGIPVTALNARGNLGVMLTLRNGRTMLIGSQRPDLLLLALTKR